MRSILLCLVLLPFALLAQETTEAVLIKELSSAASDHEKIRDLNALALWSYENNKPDAGIIYATEALALAGKLQWKEEEWNAKAIIGLCHDDKGDDNAAKDFLLPIIDTANIPANKKLYMYSLRWICNYNNVHNNHARVVAYAKPLLALRRVYGTKEKIAQTLMFIGDQYMLLDAPDKAFPYWMESVTAIGDTPPSNWINVHYNIGMVYYLRKDADNALGHFEKALALSRKWDADSNTVQNLKSIGQVYSELRHDYAKAETYFGQALAVCKKTNNQYLTTVLLMNIAATYDKRGFFPQAVNYHLQALRIAESLGKEELLATVYNDMALVYIRNHQYKEAVNYLLRAKAGFEKIGRASYLSQVDVNLGAAYAALGDTVKALKYLGTMKGKSGVVELTMAGGSPKALAIIQSIRGNYAQAIGALSQSDEATKNMQDSGDMAKSDLFLGAHYWTLAQVKDRKTLPDSLRRVSSVVLLDKALSYLNASLGYFSRKKMLAELQENHRLLAEVQKQRGDATDALNHFTKYIVLRDSVFNLKGATEMARMKIQYEFEKKEAQAAARTRMWIVAGVGVAMLLAVVFFFYRYREVSRFKSQMVALRQQALNAQMSDHFIGNTIDSINGFIQHNEKEKAGEYLTIFSRLIRNVLENASQKTVLLSEDLDVLRSYLELEALRFAEGSFTYQINVDESVHADNVLIPPMVFQVLAENCIKHGFSKMTGGHIRIQVVRKGNVMECSVQDNGIGRNASALGKERQEQHRKSFGSNLAERLVRSVNRGRDSVSFAIKDLAGESNGPLGTRVQFTLPYLTAD